ncbi:hypothetical protein QUA43_31125 [Microcoleus sp. N9_B4]|uniref:hypothetical protein n=1 Tax=Microcoleus sp. N9_B4 TaxID=3055386 RepID=UPI002FD71BD0
MKITQIGFGYTKNLGNYENCKVWLEAHLEDWEDPSESLDILRTRVAEELELPYKWHELKHQLAKQQASIETFNSIIESKKIQLAKAEEAWDNFAEFLTAHGVDPVTLKIENFAATRADHSVVPLAKYVADDSAELAFGERDTSDDYDDTRWNPDDDDDDDDY